MSRKFIGCAVLVALMSATCVSAQDNEMSLVIAKKYCGQLTTTGKTAISQGEQKDAQRAVGSLKNFLNELNRGYAKVERAMIAATDATSKAKGKEAMGLLDKAAERITGAIRHGEAGRQDEMMKTAREGNAHAEEICRLVDAMK